MEDKITAILKDEFLSADIASQDLNANLGNVVKIIEKDYNRINNKPKINGVTLQGDKSALELGLVPSDLSQLEAVEQPTKSVRQTADMFVDNGGKPSKIALQQVKDMATKIVYANGLENVDFEKLDADDYVILGDKIYRVIDTENNIEQFLPETSAEHVTFADKKGGYTSTNVEDALAEVMNVAQTGGVTGVKGNAETEYRKGDVNITKENIGLGNVDNTADLDKPISNAQETVNAEFEHNFKQLNSDIDTLGKGLNERIDVTNNNLAALRESTESALSNQQESINDIDSILNSHIANQNNPHNVTKAQVGLDKVDNTADIDKSVKEAKKATNDGVGNNIFDTYATKQALQDAVAGKAKSFSYDDYQKFVEAVNAFSNTQMAVNDNVLIVTLGVPDMWVKAKNKTSVTYTYTTDQAIINALNTTDGLTVGYYTFAQLETTKVDLSNYQQKTDGGLNTTNKTVIGAINEVKGTADNALSKANTNATEISKIKDGTTKVGNAVQCDNASKVGNAFVVSGQNAQGTESTIGFDGSQAQEVAFNEDDFVATKGNAFEVSLAPSGATAGTYNNVTVDGKGRVTVGSNKEYATPEQVNEKQNALTETQLAAVNSGITQEKVAQYDSYKTTIDEKANTSDLATVATSGSYNDLSNKPTIPTNYVTTDTSQEITGKKTFKHKDGIFIDRIHNLSGNAVYDYDGTNVRFGSVAKPAHIRGSEARPKYESPSGDGSGSTVKKDIALVDDLSNYVTTDTAQDITGKKTVISPPNADDSTQIANTAWVRENYQATCYAGRDSSETGAMYFKVASYTTVANYDNVSLIANLQDIDTPVTAQVVVRCSTSTSAYAPNAYIGVPTTSCSNISYARYYAERLFVVANYTIGTSSWTFELWLKTTDKNAQTIFNVVSQNSRKGTSHKRPWTLYNNITTASGTTDFSEESSDGRLVANDNYPYAVTVNAITPQTDGNIDLGASGQRWANGYTNRLNLSSSITVNDTGEIKADDTNGISFAGTKATTSMIRFANNDANTLGNGIVIGGGGVVIMGAGESANNLYSTLVKAQIRGGKTAAAASTEVAQSEQTYITSDNAVRIFSNCNNIANRKGLEFNNSGQLVYSPTAGGTAYTYTLPTKTGTLAETSDINNGTLTIQKNGSDVATFSANQSGNSTADIDVPTALSELTDDINVLTNNSNQNYSLAIAGSNTLNATATATYGIAIGSGAAAKYTKTIKIGIGLTPTDQSVTQIGVSGYTSSGRALYLGAGGNGYTYMNAAGSSWTSASDIRDKTDIQDIDHALDFIKKLKPITYVMNDRERYLIKDEQDNPILDENGKQQYDVEAHKRGDKKKHRRFAGLSAQDTYQAMLDCYDNDTNYAQIVDNNKFDHPDDEYLEQYSMSYERLVPFLIKAVQEQQEQIEQLKSRLGE